MKKTLLIASLAIGFAFSSCKKETTITNQLDGEVWKVVSITEVDGNDTDIENDPQISFTFEKEGGKATKAVSGFTWNVTWSVADDKITITDLGSQIYTVKNSGYSKQTWEQVDGSEITTYELEKQ
jgi:hypothetical protein